MKRFFTIDYIILKRRILNVYCDRIDKKDMTEDNIQLVKDDIDELERALYSKLRKVGKKRFLKAFSIMQKIHKLQVLTEMLKQCYKI